MAFEDGDSTKSMFFTNSNDHLVDISEQGLLRVWRYPKLELVWCRHFETDVVDMVYSSMNELVLIGFRGQLRFFVWG